ncbi:MAG: hypothetical protein J6Z25_01825 [Opitutales bacterium]|nr:hypothetical protein [Opitutales bacterium]
MSQAGKAAIVEDLRKIFIFFEKNACNGIFFYNTWDMAKSLRSLKSLLTAGALVVCSNPVFGIDFLNKKDPNAPYPTMYPTSFLFQGEETTTAELDYPWGVVKKETLYSLVQKAGIQVEDPELKKQNKLDNAIARGKKLFFGGKTQIHKIEDDWRAFTNNQDMSFQDFMLEMQSHKKHQDEKAYQMIQRMIRSLQFNASISDKKIKNIYFYESYYFYRGTEQAMTLRYNTGLPSNFGCTKMSQVVLGEGLFPWKDDDSFFDCKPSTGEVVLSSNMDFTVDLSQGKPVEVTVTSIAGKVVVMHQFHIIGYATQAPEAVALIDAWREKKGYLDWEVPPLGSKDGPSSKNSPFPKNPFFSTIVPQVPQKEKTTPNSEVKITKAPNFGEVEFTESDLESVYQQSEAVKKMIFNDQEMKNLNELLNYLKYNLKTSRIDIQQQIEKIDQQVKKIDDERLFMNIPAIEEARAMLSKDFADLYELMLGMEISGTANSTLPSPVGPFDQEKNFTNKPSSTPKSLLCKDFENVGDVESVFSEALLGRLYEKIQDAKDYINFDDQDKEVMEHFLGSVAKRNKEKNARYSAICQKIEKIKEDINCVRALGSKATESDIQEGRRILSKDLELLYELMLSANAEN